MKAPTSAPTASSALALVNASGVRMATHEGQRVIVIPAACDTPELRQSLAVLGYAGCRVLRIDTAIEKGGPKVAKSR